MTDKAQMVREHKSDCAVHNRPYTEAGPCDCGAGRFNVSETPDCIVCAGGTDGIHVYCWTCDSRRNNSLRVSRGALALLRRARPHVQGSTWTDIDAFLMRHDATEAAERGLIDHDECDICGAEGTTNFPCPECGKMRLVEDPLDLVRAVKNARDLLHHGHVSEGVDALDTALAKWVVE